MESKELKKIFGNTAKSFGFEFAYGGWFKAGLDSIVVLDLQKSNFGDYFELNIKVYIQGMFGNKYQIDKNLVKKDIGDVFTRQPAKYSPILDLDEPIDCEMRIKKLEELFREFIAPFAEEALTKSGIEKLADGGFVELLPAVSEELFKKP